MLFSMFLSGGQPYRKIEVSVVGRSPKDMQPTPKKHRNGIFPALSPPGLKFRRECPSKSDVIKISGCIT